MSIKEISAGDTSNRRVAPRFGSDFPVGLEYGYNAFCQGQALNLSTSGLRLKVDQEAALQSELKLTLCLDQDNLVELTATPVWKERVGSLGTYLIGLTFGPDQNESRTKIQTWLRKQGCAA